MEKEQENNLEIGANEKVGDYLRRVREARGLELDQLAKSIRLGKNILQQIEENNWSQFPTEAYLRSYISSMCEKLYLDKNVLLKRFSSEVNSQFGVAQANVVGEQEQRKESSGGIPKIAIIIIILVLVGLFFANKAINGDFEEKPAPEAQYEEIEEIFSEDIVEEVSDSLAIEEPPVVAKPAVQPTSQPVPQPVEASKTISKVRKDPNSMDTLRFECTPSQTDNTCGISVKGFDSKMNYFLRMLNRQINYSDTSQVTITVPERTRLFVNNVRIDYGRFNTLYFYNGEIVNKINRELR